MTLFYFVVFLVGGYVIKSIIGPYQSSRLLWLFQVHFDFFFFDQAVANNSVIKKAVV